VNEFLQHFLVEARELLAQATEDLLSLEESPDDQDRLDSAFRAFHTLKGVAAIVEFAAMTRVMHAAEGTLSAIRTGDRPITGELITAYLACLDRIEQWLDELEREDRLPEIPDATIDALVALFPATADDEPRAASLEVPLGRADWVDVLLGNNPDARAQARVAVRYQPDPDCFFRHVDPLALIAQLPQLLAVELAHHRPWLSLDELDPFICNLKLTALTGGTADQVGAILSEAAGKVEIHPLGRAAELSTPLSPETRSILSEQVALVAYGDGDDFTGRLGSAAQVGANVLRHAGWIGEAALLRQAAEESLRQGQAAPFTAALLELLVPQANERTNEAGIVPARRVDEAAVRALRVEVERIDALVKLAGELNVVKNAVGHASRMAKEGADIGALAPLLSDQHAQLDRLVQELQRSLLGIRVLPMRHVFRRFRRLIREIAADLGKPVRLVTEGEGTEADKAVVEALSEPLLHVLRNAVDHGIEPAAQRKAAGKTATATVRLSAERQGEQIVVTVEDDGAGIDLARVAAIAQSSGLASRDALAAMGEDEIMALIFAPGLSTAGSVSEVSGRGVGMDVVRSTIERLGGRVEVRSRAGEGTRVLFRLPLTVMMSQVMTIDAAGQVFGVPIEVVVETVRVPRERIVRVGEAEAFVMRDRTLPLISLAGALGLPNAGRAAPHANVVVTATAGQFAALEVDGFGERLDVMLRPVEGLLAGVRGIVGTTLLGDGRVLIVLDMQELLQ
jgi:two-component system, chemotaxis family, sensor kinase CheA